MIYHAPDGEPVDVLRLTDGELRRFRWAQTSIVFQGAMNSLNPVHRIRTQLLDVIKAHEPHTATARAPGGGPGNCWSWSASPRTGSTPIRTSCPAACASA